jgi:hypothetical protein
VIGYIVFGVGLAVAVAAIAMWLRARRTTGRSGGRRY